jgi:hypothetical protein
MSTTEVTMSEWDADPGAEAWAPFDEAVCVDCGAIVGAYLDVDPETTADVPRWNPLYRDDVTGDIYCEDCSADDLPADPEWVTRQYELAARAAAARREGRPS